MSKVYKVIMYVLDINGEPSSKRELENTLYCNKYPEHKKVESIEEADIGEWHDFHELNQHGADFGKYFK